MENMNVKNMKDKKVLVVGLGALTVGPAVLVGKILEHHALVGAGVCGGVLAQVNAVPGRAVFHAGVIEQTVDSLEQLFGFLGVVGIVHLPYSFSDWFFLLYRKKTAM